uniref:Uncharacterized protein n=1 Tax=Pseudo-nitzschia australis TaxID=44445 RepID=A0A7S4A8P5_9STRA|mmetsp:Transcript_6965/g.14813  ORF Transcript_6965/g.14813 Transcript_6965/m.14813 type:complete len:157 (-) Transcript_6965:976-1446(-)|eukprot:CAMPEP_0168185098 /NCGR_PEP_ID=MMETSP0139_2-20121125/13631_1 /TAXON_ID=44445 /ORGANISM="Pseudo-nitzschia australis, Strain 10249 10 AB" /LENGTH=156 /DNA_ID=CAMNT_0008106843 /DNA_START=127 /DNA_END=597 /DNA_ORIENTATION=-
MKSFLVNTRLMLVVAIAITQATLSVAFTIPQPVISGSTQVSMRWLSNGNCRPLYMAENGGADNKVVELVDDETGEQEASDAKATDTKAVATAPFLSQGEISEEAMEMDWNDPKQQRVMFYIILSLLPVLFLIPLMLGSRDLIPADVLPPVELSLLL